MKRKILIKNGLIVTMNETRDIFKGDLLIKGNTIEAIRKHINTNVDQIIDAENKVIIPGLIQSHIHLTQSLFKGQADDMELLDWLRDRIWPLEASHDYESNYVSAQLGLAELIKNGTTSIIDMGTVHHTEAIFQAIKESGIRALAGKCMMDKGNKVPESLLEDPQDSLREAEALIRKWHQSHNGRIEYALAPRFAVSCSDELMEGVKALSDRYHLKVHTHASENKGEIKIVEREHGMRNIEYFKSLGFTGDNLILAHCIHLDDNEMHILADTGTHIVHCPSSNMKLASGFAKIPELLEMNANVSLGSDGAPCNNNLDLLNEIRLAAYIHKPRLYDPTVMDAQTVFELATLGGAKAMGKSDQIGSLETGKLADLVIMDMDKIHSSPRPYFKEDVYSQLVYSAYGSDVEMVMVDGVILYNQGELKTLDEAQIIQRGNQIITQKIDNIKNY